MYIEAIPDPQPYRRGTRRHQCVCCGAPRRRHVPPPPPPRHRAAAPPTLPSPRAVSRRASGLC